MPSRRLIAVLVCLVFLLSGCTSIGLPITDIHPSVTLPPAEINYVAPIGDAALEYKDTATLYLPSRDGISLVSLETELSFSLVRPVPETIIRALIAHGGNRDATPLGGNVRLSLYGANPVEISRNVATVNLSASALQLDREELYIVCQAIANTLTELDEISYVNVLVVDKPVGLDISNTLPMGALESNFAQDLGAVYEQLLSRRVTTEQAASSTPLLANIALYFPLLNSDGLICEERTLSFENQHMPDMVVAILRELASGPADSSIVSTELPLLADLLISPPKVIQNHPAGGQIISLDFTHNLDDMLDAYGVTRKQCTASLCYTLSSFFPNVSGIILSINGTAINEMMLTDESATRLTEDHVFLRSAFASLIYDYCTIYFVDEETQMPTPSRRAIPYHQCTNPRVLLCELAKGPLPGDSRPELAPVMEKNAITDTTILGFAIKDKTLLTNFAPSFAKLGTDLTGAEERLLAYSLVNTLCMNEQVQAVCFYQSGSQFESFSGEIYWSGLFLPLNK